MTDFDRPETRILSLPARTWHMLAVLTMATGSNSLEHFLERLASGEWGLDEVDENESGFTFVPLNKAEG